MKHAIRVAVMAVVLLGGGSGGALAQSVAPEEPKALEACLTAWGEHPFGSRPVYTRLSTSVKVAGVGPATTDSEITDHPSLILVDPLVNVMGQSSIALMNPNGWYCLRAAVNVLGALRIQLHCQARLASASGGATVWGTGYGRPGVTVMGSIEVERVGCDGA